MLRTLRHALAPVGGAQVLLALGAVAWGLGRLHLIAEERQAHINELEQATAVHEEALRLVREHLAAVTPDDAQCPRTDGHLAHSTICPGYTTPEEAHA